MVRAVCAVLLLGLGLTACGPDQENVTAASEAAAPATIETTPPRPQPAAPSALQEKIAAVAGSVDGEMGVAVMDLEEGWIAAHRGREDFPQQSVSKVWLAVAVLDRVDRGELSLDETVLLEPRDLSVFHQPLRPRVIDDGRHVATIGDLLALTITRSDNAATDVLMRRVGGGDAVQKVIDRKGVEGVRAGEEQRLLQPRIAALQWRPEFADLSVFNQARDAVPEATRTAAMNAYIRNPADAATPVGTVRALAALRQGRLLSPESTQRLLGLMSDSRSGVKRLKAGAPEGWTLAHKTGTGQDRDGWTIGYNDVGLLTAPDGRTYAVAAYIRRTGAGLGERQRVIADVARAVVEHWERERGPVVQTPPAA